MAFTLITFRTEISARDYNVKGKYWGSLKRADEREVVKGRLELV